MKNKKLIAAVAVIAVVSGAAYYAYERQATGRGSGRSEILAMMPPDASAVLFVDLADLRATPFLTQLFAASPAPTPDPEYAEFLKETGFNYERDLNRAGVAILTGKSHSTFLAIVEGRFDKQKITPYALKNGKASAIEGKTVYTLTSNANSDALSFAMLRDDQMLLTNDPSSSEKIHTALHVDSGREEWRVRFDRLAGSPAFAVIRQNAAPGAALSAQAPGGFRSPQLSTLLDQLQWVTIAGKPDNDSLRIVLDGECPTEATARQLSDVLNGVVILAEGGLNDPKTRQRLDPATRMAYLNLLKSADISKVQRGDISSVRLILEIGPDLWGAARKTIPNGPEGNSEKSQPGKPASKKGRT